MADSVEDIDAETFVEKLYRGLDPVAVNALWTLEPVDKRRGPKPKPKTNAHEARHGTIEATAEGQDVQQNPPASEAVGVCNPNGNAGRLRTPDLYRTCG